MSVEAKVRSAVAEQLCCDEAKITGDSRLVEDLRADSLDIVELLQRLEDMFGRAVDEKSAMGLRTVTDVTRYVESLLQSEPAAPPVAEAQCTGESP